MPITSVDVQNNPLVRTTGTPAADMTIINTNEDSGVLVTYEIQKRDGSDKFKIASTLDVKNIPQIDSVNGSKLKMILRERTKYRVRMSANGVTSAWFKFKTRDKTYKSPHAITSLSDDTDDTATVKGGRTIVVTNAAKAVVVDNGKNATVTNSNDFGNGTTSITYGAHGATVNTQTF